MKKTKFLGLFLISILLIFPFYKVLAIGAAQKRPKVSIVVPVYKVEKWLRECMNSLVNQTLNDIEIICVDDGSPDNSGTILDEYAEKDSRIKVIHQKNAGVQMARNAGLDAATGEYIALVDSDDYVDLRTYETAYNLAKKDDLDILNFGSRKFKNGENDNNEKNEIDFSDSKIMSKEEYIKDNFRCYVWDNIFKSDIIQKDKVRFIPGIRPADDTCFTYMALAKAQKIKAIPAQFYNYRIMPGTLSRMKHSDRFLNSYKMFKYICDSWRERDCVKNNEHSILTLAIRWLSGYWNMALRHSNEILDFFGSDIYNQQSIDKCSDEIKIRIKKLAYSAKSNANPPLKDGIYRIKGIKENFKKYLCISKENKKEKYNLAFCKPNKKILANTNFEIKKNDIGYYSITPLFFGKSAKIAGFSNIKWYLVPCGRETFKIISAKDLSALEIREQEKNSFETEHFETKNNQEQLFKFEKVG